MNRENTVNELGFNWQDTLIWCRHSPAPTELPLAAAQALLGQGSELLPPVRGTVFGTLLNDKKALQALGDAVHQDPYKAPPKAPILYIKPRNSHCAHGDRIPLPQGIDGLLAGPALGLVIGRTACRVPRDEALSYLAGYTIVNDLTVPHDSYYRPALPCKARDHSCPIGPWVRAPRQIANPDQLAITVRVNDSIRLQANTADLIRPVAQLLHEVSAFMTLNAGDILLAGVPAGAPLLHAGDTVSVEIEQIGTLTNTLIAAQGGAL